MQTNPLRSVEDARVDGIYRLVKGRINFVNLIPTCIEVAKEIEQIQGLKGPQKLAMLQDVLRLAVRDSRLSDSEKDATLHVVDTIVPLVVQAAILASKSPIVKHVQDACVGCWTKRA